MVPAVPENGIYTMHNITENDIRVVRDKYPQYFNLDTSQGLTVYVHPSTNGNTCQLVSGKDPVPTGEQLTHMTGTTIPEMTAILTAYEIPSNSISIVPYRLPYSVLTYITDEKTIKEITGAFGIAPQSYNAEVNDCIIFDIDNDGADELCVVLSLPNFSSSTRLFIYALSVRELTDAQDEYYYTWGAQYRTDLSFQIGKNEKLQIQETEKYTDSSKTALIDIDIKNGRILRIEESP